MKLLAVTGSSGGHIFPALGFLDALNNKRKDADILLVLPRENITERVKKFDYKVDYISISSVKFGISPRSLGSILKFFKGALESIVMLLKFRPGVVVGFGSIVSVPMVLFSRFLGIKTLIHEQNVIPGRANRFLASFADKIAISFAESADYLKVYKRKIILTGNPIRRELNRVDKNKALDFFRLDSRKFTVLVMGGSQGSQRINSAFLKAVSAMPDRSRLQVIHLTGPQGYGLLEKSYKDLSLSCRLFDFLEPMQYAYSACDLVVSRAGATAVTEIIFYGLPAILIPYPFAYNHQIANAEALRRIGSGIIIQDNDSAADILGKNIDGLMNDPGRIKAMVSHYGNIPRLSADDLLADAVLSLN
ncbi:MAG: UDP-N-acetylglucosamine--N-acetylmuramyl-(pentapeptide) pyrophosphoryl-undecaprenol N-acetylglucosamine transferase [Candidatus Omnitrophota bacterium]